MRDAARTWLAAACSLIVVVLGYPLARVGEHLAFGETNPAVIVASNRIALYWRTGIVVCLAIALFPVFFELARRPEALVARLPLFLLVASLALAIQVALVP